MESNNQFFYVFLNIKGALYTADWVKFIQASCMEMDDSSYSTTVKKLITKHPEWNKYYKNGSYLKQKHIRKICPYNVMALNRLLDDLKLDYNVNLVITSHKWKDSFDLKTIPSLVKNGLNYSNLIIDKTSSRIEDVADGILDYLTHVGNPNNYLIIDYQDSVLRKFEDYKTIKVDQYELGLEASTVDNYLDNIADLCEENNYETLTILQEKELQQNNI